MGRCSSSTAARGPEADAALLSQLSKVRQYHNARARRPHNSIAGLVRTLGLARRTEPLSIYVPEGQEDAVRELVGAKYCEMIKYPIRINTDKGRHRCARGDDYNGDGLQGRPHHQVLRLRFRRERKNPLIKEKADALGIKGKMFLGAHEEGNAIVGGKRVTLSSITTKERGKR